MPTTTQIQKATAWEDAGLRIMARLRGNTGSLIVQADFTAIAASVWPFRAPTSPTLDASALTVASVVFDTLQTTSDDARWTKDSTGYNFAYTIPASAFPDPGVHRVEVIFNPASGDDWPLVYLVDVEGLFIS